MMQKASIPQHSASTRKREHRDTQDFTQNRLHDIYL